MVNDPPFPPDQIRDPKDPKLDQAMKTFAAWFEKKKPALKKAAEAEQPHLRVLAAELQTPSIGEYKAKVIHGPKFSGSSIVFRKTAPGC